ncbi:MAG: dihydroneopterin aldolase [Rickettsia endosymbiont of Bryobia graminum]|nr:dihydroneopterin aldolase [Rickettsia endosymbiont of Bryobia graminum]
MRVWIHLGCSDQEKFHAQLVSFNIELEFKSLLKGTKTDKLEDVICYSQLVKHIKSFCQNKKFNLIEYLVVKVHTALSKSLLQYSDIIKYLTVTVHKISTPAPDLHGGAIFTYCSNIRGESQ